MRCRSQKMGSVSWSEIPEDIFLTIAGRLHTVIDYLNVSRVCKSWRSTVLNLSIPSRPPFLMLSAESKNRSTEEDEKSSLRGIVEFNNQGNPPKVCSLSLPEIHDDVRIMGSTGNWLILIDLELDIFIFNPFTKTRLQFPSQSTLPEQLYNDDECDCGYDCDCNAALAALYTQEELRNDFIQKAFLSSSNVSDVVMVITFGARMGLAIARPGDLSWTTVQKQIASCEYYVDAVMDGIFFRGQFYSVNGKAKIGAFDVNSTPPKAVKVMEAFENARNVGESRRYYLVEWVGKLLLVIRYFCRYKVKPFYGTVRFKVYMLDFNNKEWEEVMSLGEHSVFLGHNTSVSLLISEYSPFKKNCIYFTDNVYIAYMGMDKGGGHDMGVFDLNDKTINPYYGEVSTSFHSPPLWIIPQSAS